MISKLKASFFAMLVFALPCAAMAEEAHGEGGVPMSVFWQAINFVIYLFILWYFLRKPTRAFFASRYETYERSLSKADQARKDAERKKHEIEERLSKLENASQETLATAKAEAAAMGVEIQKQAEDLVRRLREEAARSATMEIERAKSELREELLQQAAEQSKRILEEKIQAPDQKRLQTEFVEKVQNNSANLSGVNAEGAHS